MGYRGERQEVKEVKEERQEIKEERQAVREEKKKLRRENREDRRQYLFAIQELTGREIKRKYARSHLGVLWSVLNPMLSMIVITLVFSTMFKKSIEHFPLYYLAGQTIWSFFSTATNTSMSALVDNKNLLIKGRLPKYAFILSRIYTALVNLGYSMIAFIVMLLFFQITPCWMMLLFPLDVMLLLFFSMGIGLALSVLYVFFADVKYLYSIVLTLWLYLSAIFYPVSRLPEYLRTFIEYNPIYIAIYIARECMVYGNEPEFMPWFKLFLWAVGSLWAGLYVFRKYENNIMQKI